MVDVNNYRMEGRVMTAKRMRVTICDDDRERARGWARRIDQLLPGAEWEVVALEPVEFARAVGALSERVKKSKAQDFTKAGDAAEAFDLADILILDSDLTPDPSSDPGDDPDNLVDTYLAGEIGSAVARLARAHTSVGVIVVVNQGFKQRTFDLTMMRWSNGPADVYISHEDIDNPNLWFPSAPGGFRPWSWPTLTQMPNAFRSVLTHDVDDRILDVLGLAAEPDISFRQLEALLPNAERLAGVTLRQVAESTSFGLGVSPKEVASDAQLARVGVLGLRRWVDRYVVPPQNVLVDLPHLLQDRPWLTPERHDLGSWNKLLWSEAPVKFLPEAFNSAASQLLGRPVWDVASLTNSLSDGRASLEDPVFCEDTSRFISADAARDFVSDIEGPYNGRFVEHLEGIDYVPRHRLYS